MKFYIGEILLGGWLMMIGQMTYLESMLSLWSFLLSSHTWSITSHAWCICRHCCVVVWTVPLAPLCRPTRHFVGFMTFCWEERKKKLRRISTAPRRRNHHLTESSEMGGKHVQDDCCTGSQMTQISCIYNLNSTEDDGLRVTVVS